VGWALLGHILGLIHSSPQVCLTMGSEAFIWPYFMCYLLDNSLTNQFAISQVVDLKTSPAANF